MAGEHPDAVGRIVDDLGFAAVDQDDPRARREVADVDRFAHSAAFRPRGSLALRRQVARSAQLSAAMNSLQRRYKLRIGCSLDCTSVMSMTSPGTLSPCHSKSCTAVPMPCS